MIAVLHTLSEQAASVRRLGESYDDPILKAIAADLAAELVKALDSLAEQQGVLVGEMPWWSRSRCDKIADPE
jgi:hypothetical protein